MSQNQQNHHLSGEALPTWEYAMCCGTRVHIDCAMHHVCLKVYVFLFFFYFNIRSYSGHQRLFLQCHTDCNQPTALKATLCVLFCFLNLLFVVVL